MLGSFKLVVKICCIVLAHHSRPSSSTSMENKIFIRIAVMLIVSEELCKTKDDWIIGHPYRWRCCCTHTHTYDEREHYDDDDEDDFMLYSNLLHSKAIGY